VDLVSNLAVFFRRYFIYCTVHITFCLRPMLGMFLNVLSIR